MKKLLLLAAAAFMAGSASAATWAVVGSYTDPNWNFEASTVLEGTGDVLSCQIDHLISDFKIVDIDDSTWAIQYGTAEEIELGKTYTLQGKNGGADPDNMSFAGNILAVNDATVTWNPTTFEMTITGTAEIGYPTLYITGSFTTDPKAWADPGSNEAYLCNRNGSVYTVTVDLGTSGNVEFKLAGEGWSNEIAGGVIVNHEKVTVTKGGDNLKTELTGEQTLEFDIEAMTMYFTGTGGEWKPEPLVAPDQLYILGNILDNDWDPENGVPGYVTSNGVFEFYAIDLLNGENENSWFTFVASKGDWGTVNAQRYGPAPGVNDALTVGSTTMFYISDKEPSWNVPNGKYDFIVNFNTLELTVTACNEDHTGGVSSLGADANSPAVYYNLQGVKVSNPQNGIFVVKQGDKTRKVVIR